jgi:hypothetical protein
LTKPCCTQPWLHYLAYTVVYIATACLCYLYPPLPSATMRLICGLSAWIPFVLAAGLQSPQPANFTQLECALHQFAYQFGSSLVRTNMSALYDALILICCVQMFPLPTATCELTSNPLEYLHQLLSCEIQVSFSIVQARRLPSFTLRLLAATVRPGASPLPLQPLEGLNRQHRVYHYLFDRSTQWSFTYEEALIT